MACGHYRYLLSSYAATKWLKLAMETDEKRKSSLEKMVATTQLQLALETEEKRRAKNGLDLIWIEIATLQQYFFRVCYYTHGRLHYCGSMCGSSQLNSACALLCVATLNDFICCVVFVFVFSCFRIIMFDRDSYIFYMTQAISAPLQLPLKHLFT